MAHLLDEEVKGTAPHIASASAFRKWRGNAQRPQLGWQEDANDLMLRRMMENLRPFTFNEKFSVGLLLLFVPVYLFTAIALLPGSVLAAQDFMTLLIWQVAWFIIAAIAACTAIATLFFKPDHHPSRPRMQLGRTLPLVSLIVALLLNSAIHGALSTRQLRTFAQLHSEELIGYPPRAVIYREGMPDGGVAIIRSPGQNPEGLPQRVMKDLTGERIKSCSSINDSDWSCHFD